MPAFLPFLLVSIGSAQERGSVRGLVKSDAGQALENATVVILVQSCLWETYVTERRELYFQALSSR